MKNIKNNIIILVLISLVVMFFTLKDNFLDVLYNLKNINFNWLFIAFLMIVIYHLSQALCIYIQVKKVKKNYKYKNALSLNLFGSFFNGITPFSSGGQPFQIYILKKEGIKVSDSGNILLQNFLSYQIMLILMGTISIVSNFKLNIIPEQNLLKKAVVFGYTINCLVLVFLFTFCFFKKFNSNILKKISNKIIKLKFIKNKKDKIEKFNKLLDNFYTGAVNINNNKQNFLLTLMLNSISLVSLYLIPLFLFYSLGDFNSINLIKSIISSAYTYLIGSFVPIPGGSGGLEYSFVDFFKFYKSGSFLSTVLLLWRFITYYFGIIIGGISLIFYKKESD